jgi:hypothetical protein
MTKPANGTVKATAITYSAGCFRQRVGLILLNFLRPPDRQKPTKHALLGCLDSARQD